MNKLEKTVSALIASNVEQAVCLAELKKNLKELREELKNLKKSLWKFTTKKQVSILDPY